MYILLKRNDMTYRGYTIERDVNGNPNGFLVRNEQDSEDVAWVSTKEDAWLAIDDAIIERLLDQIEHLKTALENSQAVLKGTQSALSQIIAFDSLDEQIKQNEQALKLVQP